MKYLIAIAALISIQGYSQDIKSSSITWTVNQLNDLSTGKSISYWCLFKTSSGQSIVWEQNKGYTINFDVVSTTGSWTNVSTTGKLTYNVTSDGDDGTIIFEKDQTGVYITLDWAQGSGDRLRRKYTVTNVEF